MTADVAIIILTYNEEKNVGQALESVCGWARQVFVLDSFSSDSTLEVAGKYDVVCSQNQFRGFVEQRNYALQTLPIHAEWVFFLDADEWVTNELREEVSALIANKPEANGFYVKRRFIWMNRWLRYGYYPVWILRLVRHGKGQWEARTVNEHMVVEGNIGYLHHDIVHQDHRGVRVWIDKHNYYAELEAEELLREVKHDCQLPAQVFGTQAERKRWLRHNVWNKLPPLLRPLLYFAYRYIVRGGFLDGIAGFSYHFLHALWYPMLIDINYLELRRIRDVTNANACSKSPAISDRPETFC